VHDLIIRGGTVVDGSGATPVVADVAVDDDRIVAIGTVRERGRREITADGALVAPGWVDVHTHYDGQATWDPELAPSSWHGVTTAVMGSCGVGFAPVRPGSEAFLIELMEGVEDIPGSALHEGLTWGWETFGEYLDALGRLARTIDVGALVPHAAVRAYVLGERAHDEDNTADEVAAIAAIVGDALRAGAVGFSTSRTGLHRSKHGLVPGTRVAPDELEAIADAMADAGGGVFQYVSDNGTRNDGEWVRVIAARPGITVSYTLAPPPGRDLDPTSFIQRALDDALASAQDGMRLVPQVPARPIGMLFGLQSSFHTFVSHPSFRPLRGAPLADLVARLRDPGFRAQLVGEESAGATASALAQNWEQIFRLGNPPDYEPAPGTSAGAVADRTGRAPAEVVLDWMLEDDGMAFLFAPLGSYAGDLELIRLMNEHPASIAGLSDGGAHCGLICDASFPTYLLTHWARDRQRGPRLPIELVVHKQTAAPAAAFGLTDRGRIAPGLLADLNVIDHQRLHLHPPRMVRDLPAAGRRLVQPVDGYVATVKSGRITFEDGEPTGERPGTVVRRPPGG
jgi:N-acyl-D-aspartate/D-glutamate deacylase